MVATRRSESRHRAPAVKLLVALVVAQSALLYMLSAWTPDSPALATIAVIVQIALSVLGRFRVRIMAVSTLALAAVLIAAAAAAPRNTSETSPAPLCGSVALIDSPLAAVRGSLWPSNVSFVTDPMGRFCVAIGRSVRISMVSIEFKGRRFTFTLPRAAGPGTYLELQVDDPTHVVLR